MDTNAVTIIAAILGAVIGAPAGFGIERLANRPRLKISYAETAFEDIYAFPVDVVLGVARLPDFISFVNDQVNWKFNQRIEGNLFTHEELRLISEFGERYAGLLRQSSERIEWILKQLEEGQEQVGRCVPDLETEYNAYLNAFLNSSSSLSADLKKDPETTIKNFVEACNLQNSRFDLTRELSARFFGEVKKALDQGHGTSGRVIVRISIGNTGYQDAIIQTEARLLVGNKRFRLPLQTASRPWEASETKGPSQFQVISQRSFRVMEFLVDENLNAKDDLDKLKNELRRGVGATVNVLGIDGSIFAGLSFKATLD
jgi:hypothetical protein